MQFARLFLASGEVNVAVDPIAAGEGGVVGQRRRMAIDPTRPK